MVVRACLAAAWRGAVLEARWPRPGATDVSLTGPGGCVTEGNVE